MLVDSSRRLKPLPPPAEDTCVSRIHTSVPAWLSRRFGRAAVVRPQPAAPELGVPAQLAGRIAAGLYALCGLLGLVGLLLPIGLGADAVIITGISCGAVFLSVVAWFLPWNAWPRWCTHLLVPIGFGLIAVGIAYGGVYAFVFGAMYCAAFAAVGLSHRPGTSVVMLPLFVAAYALPIGIRTGDMALALSLAGFIGVLCLMVAETVAWITFRLRQTQLAVTQAHSAVDDISSGLTSMDARDLARSAASRLSALLDVPKVDVYSLGDGGNDTDDLECLASTSAGELRDEQAAPRQKVSLWDSGRRAMATSEPVVEEGVRSSVTIPLVSRGKVVGLVEITEDRPYRSISSTRMADASSVCRLVALSIQDAQALAAQEEQTCRLASMLESSQAVAGADTLEEALSIVSHRAAGALAVHQCVAYEHMQEIDAIIARAMWERAPTGWDRLDEVIPLSGYSAERKVLAGDPPLLENLSDPDLAPVSKANMQAWGEMSCLTVPMRSAEGPQGLLVFWDSERERHFSAEELALALGLAELAGEAVRRAKLVRSLQRLSGMDSLTGLANHRQFHELLAREQARAERHGLGFSLVMLDIDGFKLLNDTYGHPCGDSALRHVASLLQLNARASDVVGRYGGDEFVLILSETDTAEATRVVDKLRVAISEKPFVIQSGERIPIRASFGVASYPQDARGVNELVVAADSALYASKRRGGDAITAAGHSEQADLHEATSFGILESTVATIDSKDKYTRRHSEEVTALALALAGAMGLPESTLRVVRTGALLHDVGKIGIPDRVLRKPGQLTPEEWAIVKGHPSMGETLVRTMPDLHEIESIVAYHHERFDGTGYPRGLSGTDIPLLARIVAVADAYSAMTTDRPYRQALSPRKAVEELIRGSGTQFDPGMVTTFLRCLNEAPAGPLMSASERQS
jgi:diguanylate cyclase (GGDEF)-like protein/putative nucleotidyltransferase with HDIG domain